MLQEIIDYGDTGKDNCLNAIHTGFLQQMPIGNVSSHIASKVIPRLLDVFKSTFLNEKRTVIWHALTYLCDRSKNPAAASFAHKLENSLILHHVVEACENYPMSECNASLAFLTYWVTGDGRRQDLILRSLRVLRIIFKVIDSAIAVAEFEVVGNVLGVCLMIMNCNAPLDTFTRLGGLSKLTDTLNILTARAVTLSETGDVPHKLNVYIQLVVRALSNFQGAVWRQYAHLCDLHIDTYLIYFSMEAAQQHTVSLNNAFDIFSDTPTRRCVLQNALQSFCYCMLSAGRNLEDPNSSKQAFEIAEYVLLTPGPISGQCLLVKCVRELRATEEMVGTPSEKLLAEIDKLMNDFPTLSAAVSDYLGEPLVRCSLPGCSITNIKRGRLKKCVRCMSVWYCGKEHQVAHWKEHKQVCCAPCTVSPESEACGDATK